ncbi:hypothetical protein JCM15765_42290 [Paradesulfitobacterium aromaticivorans]
METYFYQDPGIQEHIDQIVEKLFATCLLTGPDADAEFQRGLKSAHKLVSALATSLASLPETEINNGVRQIIEQRLPDTRVIENFPVFYEMMERMINEAVSASVRTPFELNDSPDSVAAAAALIQPTQAAYRGRVNIIDGGSGVSDNSQIKIRDYQNLYRESLQAGILSPEIATVQNSPEHWGNREDTASPEKESLIDDEGVNKSGMPELTLIEVNTVEDEQKVELGEKEKEKAETEIVAEAKPEVEIVAEVKPLAAVEPKQEFKQEPVPGPIRRQIQVPAGAERLALVLRQVFPKSPVRWNLTLAGYNFLAQVEDILLYIDSDLNGSEFVQRMKKEGWTTIVCAQDDLGFPRRLEREIRRSVQRKTSKVKVN